MANITYDSFNRNGIFDDFIISEKQTCSNEIKTHQIYNVLGVCSQRHRNGRTGVWWGLFLCRQALPRIISLRDRNNVISRKVHTADVYLQYHHRTNVPIEDLYLSNAFSKGVKASLSSTQSAIWKLTTRFVEKRAVSCSNALSTTNDP